MSSYASGGTSSNYTSNNILYYLNMFTNVGTSTFTVSNILAANILIVAGGGGGGCPTGGGGGAGGYQYYSSQILYPGSYQVTVGGGGAGGNASTGNGTNGSNSVFGVLPASIGGGGGANRFAGGLGGSGGGGAGSLTAGSGTAGQGYAGGGSINGGNYEAGGGGGAGGVGGTGVVGTPGVGGIGVQNAITGTPTYYAGGGGGGWNGSATGALGGLGGGGNGGNTATAGTANTGGGGGGSDNYTGTAAVGGAGGSGIVIIQFSQISVIINIPSPVVNANLNNNAIISYITSLSPLTVTGSAFATYATLTWQSSTNASYYTVTATSNTSNTLTQITSNNNIIFTGLSSNTSYNFTITPYNSFGISNVSITTSNVTTPIQTTSSNIISGSNTITYVTTSNIPYQSPITFSSASNAITSAITPTTPTQITGTLYSTYAALSWQSSVNTNYYQVTSTPTTTTQITYTPSIIFTGLSPVISYTFTITPYNSQNIIGSPSSYSFTYSFTYTILYSMTFPFTFTTLGASGGTAPSSLSSYSSIPGNSTSYVMTLNNGIQFWTIPTTGTYQIIAAGAGQTNAGYGIIVSNTYYLTGGTILAMLVGQAIGNGVGGSGGTFVTLYNNASISTYSPILIAGGGGGVNTSVANSSANAVATTTGGSGGGTGGMGGGGNYLVSSGGGGFLGLGGSGGGNGEGGGPAFMDFVNSSLALTDTSCGYSFGGGSGGVAGYNGNGAGGGYSGGGTSAGGTYQGGGGSYDLLGTSTNATIYTGSVPSTYTSQVASGYNKGAGFVSVNYTGTTGTSLGSIVTFTSVSVNASTGTVVVNANTVSGAISYNVSMISTYAPPGFGGYTSGSSITTQSVTTFPVTFTGLSSDASTYYRFAITPVYASGNGIQVVTGVTTNIPSLYTMTYPFTFTSMGASGASAPASITYGTATPGYGTSYVMTLTSGIQYWTVPQTRSYQLIAAGASGGSSGTSSGGQGIVVYNSVSLTINQVIAIIVGELGGNSSSVGGTGGGGTFVIEFPTSFATGTTPFNTYPPALLTSGPSSTSGTVSVSGQSYGNGTYTISSDSGSANYWPWYAFADLDQSNGLCWSGAPYNTSTGAYTGTSSLNGISGSWLSMTLPSTIYLLSYTIGVRKNDGIYWEQAPQTWTLLGSNNGGSSWTVIKTYNFTFTYQGQVQTFGVYSTTAYNQYAFVFQTMGLQGSGANGIVSLRYVTFQGSTSQFPVPLLIAGGGGGGGYPSGSTGGNGLVSTAGAGGGGGAGAGGGGSGGSGGVNAYNTATYGGAGFVTNGSAQYSPPVMGPVITYGGLPTLLNGTTISSTNVGAFGGGGGGGGGGTTNGEGGGLISGGGGGGYSGGGAGSGQYYYTGGGGGGSYDINGTNNNATLYTGSLPSGVSGQVTSGYNTGNGFVVIT